MPQFNNILVIRTCVFVTALIKALIKGTHSSVHSVMIVRLTSQDLWFYCDTFILCQIRCILVVLSCKVVFTDTDISRGSRIFFKGARGDEFGWQVYSRYTRAYLYLCLPLFIGLFHCGFSPISLKRKEQLQPV